MSLSGKLFLLDGMALIYRAHFAFISRPIIASSGLNTSALFGYTSLLIDLIRNQKPTHLAVAFDTQAPTERHRLFPQYKAQRESIPEDLATAIPHIFRITEAFNIPVLKQDGYEADDIIGTLSLVAEQAGLETFMVTPDKDFTQLVSPRTWVWKPGRQGSDSEILGVREVLEKWSIQNIDQVRDILGLWGDTSDNIPGIPGIGEKTAQKLIQQYGSIENLLEHADELKGKQRENVIHFKEQALLSKKLVTIDRNVPLPLSLEDLVLRPSNDEVLRDLFVEFEFNALGKRWFGESFQAGRGYSSKAPQKPSEPKEYQVDLFESEPQNEFLPEIQETPLPSSQTLANIHTTPHSYQILDTPDALEAFLTNLAEQKAFCFDCETTNLEIDKADILGIAFSWEAHSGYYLPFPSQRSESLQLLKRILPIWENPNTLKIGHNLKYDLGVLRCYGLVLQGPFFDTMIAHALIDPETRHGMDFLSERYLGYQPIPITQLLPANNQTAEALREVPLQDLADYAAEDADVTWQLYQTLTPYLSEKGLEKVFHEIECPLIPVLVEMEFQGIRINPDTLNEISINLASEIQSLESKVHELAGKPFNLSSPKQIGEILFDHLKILEKPKKTKSGQYSTNEATLNALAPRHLIVKRILEFRAASKLKSTYVDALPREISPRTGRIHTTYNSMVTATGRLQSHNPNLQNVPVRTEQGKEIRRAFISRSIDYALLSADYSQIELRIIASISEDPTLCQAFRDGLDIHAATAQKIYGVFPQMVTPEMRRTAKTVNFGIIYGISPFGLSQRLGISRTDATALIEQYFKQFPGIQQYLDQTIAFAKKHGYVQTLTGRRRYLRDIRSANNTTSSAAERMAVNMPIQGTAADMIKLAMIRIHRLLKEQETQTQLLLQVHDELVFDLHLTEKDSLLPQIREAMKTALPLNVPVEVDIGIGKTWLDAH